METNSIGVYVLTNGFCTECHLNVCSQTQYYFTYKRYTSYYTTHTHAYIHPFDLNSIKLYPFSYIIQFNMTLCVCSVFCSVVKWMANLTLLTTRNNNNRNNCKILENNKISSCFFFFLEMRDIPNVLFK